MDNLCHTLTGAAFAEAGLKTHTRFGTAAHVIAANLPDADVVALALEGKDDAHRELIERYERPIFTLVFRMVRNRELAEDLTQDTFIKVLSHLDRYRTDFKFSSWLFKIANTSPSTI